MSITNKSLKPVKKTIRQIYLFCYPISKGEKKANLLAFFSKGLLAIEQRILHQPIFLSEKKALYYSSFLDQDHLILRAYVPDYVIEGKHQALVLKQGFILRQHVHGCLTGWEKGKRYYLNPFFVMPG